jgi:2-succinyl-6-hydroxy-2,4-cyclohexadiene-1-carboxylate synthase
MSTPLVALPGFLGRAGDWDAVRRHSRTPFRWICPELFTADAASWSQPPALGEQAWLAGYSFGARLALRWLAEFPGRWHGALLLSVNPGNFQTDEERARRREEDLRWAQAFRNDPWDDVLGEWNTREVFNGAAQPERREQDYDKHRLGDALDRFSVGEQFTDIERLPTRIHWMAGAKDPKFCALLESMRQDGFPGTFEIVPDAGHRLLHDAPAVIAAVLDRLTA